MNIVEQFGKKIIVFDGAMGTQLQAAGLAVGEYPDPWNIDHSEEVKEIHKKYLLAGSDVITSNTFGSNRLNAGSTGYSVEELITAAIKNCRGAIAEIIDKRKKDGLPERQMFTALDIGPTGKIVDLMGDLDFDGAYELFKEQVIAGTQAGADLIIFETFSDIVELKAGIMAAKENSSLPIFCTMTFQDDGRMLMGTDPETAILAIQDLGISAIGVNCSLGPKELLPIISKIMNVAKIPVIAQPNAGLPNMKDGVATYDISQEEFADYIVKILETGVSVVGGCCGTTPEYISKLSEKIEGKDYPALKRREENARSEKVVCTTTKHVFVGEELSIIEDDSIDMDELTEDILAGDYEEATDVAMDIIDEGADIVAINMGFPMNDEGEALKETIHTISMNGNLPIAIYSNVPEHIEDAVRYCRGRPLVMSNCLEGELSDDIIRVAEKYGVDVVRNDEINGIMVGLNCSRK